RADAVHERGDGFALGRDQDAHALVADHEVGGRGVLVDQQRRGAGVDRLDEGGGLEVEPEALVVEKLRVSVPEGRPLMKGEMSTPATDRPSSARMEATSRRVITHSRPSPARWAYTPRSMARSRVDLPW